MMQIEKKIILPHRGTTSQHAHHTRAKKHIPSSVIIRMTLGPQRKNLFCGDRHATVGDVSTKSSNCSGDSLFHD